MDFRADCVEYRSADGVETVFLGHAEKELALTMSSVPGTSDHYFEWNDQANACTNAVKSIQLSGRTLRIQLLAKAAKRLGEGTFTVELECDNDVLEAVSRLLSRIFRSQFNVARAVVARKQAPATKTDYSKIKYLNLEGRNLRVLPDYVQEMTALETAKLGRNPQLDFHAVCEVLANLPSLRQLDFTTDQPVPENIGKLTQLEGLQLTGFTTPQVLPEGMGQLRKLKSLLLMSDSDIVLPESFAGLADLEALNVRAASWKLPSRFYRLTRLTDLDLSHCRLGRVPEEMAGMDGVKTVALGGSAECDYEQILTVVARMPNVKRLELSTNPVPKTVGLCRQIEELVIWAGLDPQRPLRLPDEMFELSQLKTLILNLNTFDELPAGIGKLKGLEQLAFGESDFAVLPEPVGELSNLVFLRIEENPSLRTLPESLGNLRQLRDLYLSDNPQLTRLPDSFQNLTGLERIRLSGSENVSNVPESWKGKLI